jgi:hypothetical protein
MSSRVPSLTLKTYNGFMIRHHDVLESNVHSQRNGIVPTEACEELGQSSGCSRQCRGGRVCFKVHRQHPRSFCNGSWLPSALVMPRQVRYSCWPSHSLRMFSISVRPRMKSLWRFFLSHASQVDYAPIGVPNNTTL